MRVAVALKVLQHAAVRQLLIGTGDAVIVEKASGDSYWGCGPYGTGRNMLGLILMEVRNQLVQGNLAMLTRVRARGQASPYGRTGEFDKFLKSRCKAEM